MRDFLYSLFFPNPKNNHKAHFLSSKFFLVISLFFIFGALFFSPATNPLINQIKVQADVSLNELLDLTNQKRIDNNLEPLRQNNQLNQAAEKKAYDMFDKNYWAHNSPDGVTPWVFIKGAGYDYVYAGENLARGFSSASDVVDAWMASPSHRENLLSSNYEDVGFAIKSGKLNGEETVLVVQEFGSKNILTTDISANDVKGENSPINFLSVFTSINNLSFSDNLVIIILLALILLLVIDIFMIEKKKISRFAGHNEDHIIYVAGIIIIIFIMTTGVIL